MNDRELLEYAAKAAGLELAEYQSQSGALWLARGYANPSTGSREWNPLTDDGDAFRLAVKLHISTNYVWDGENDQYDPVYAEARGRICCEEQIGIFRYEQIDELRATRRAIVRAAAEIGKAMP